MHPLVSSSLTNLVGLVRAYGCERQFVPRLLYLLLMTALRQPLTWTAAATYARRTRRQQIDPPPIFIIGHWRSGTTHLQNLMCRDPQFGRVTLLQAAMPHEFLLFGKAARRRLGRLLPSTRLMDNVPVAADVPWEEELALTAVCRLSFYHVSFFPRCMGRIFRDAVLFDGGNPTLIDEWRRHYLDFLRKVQFEQPGMRLLLKNPANTARVSLLREIFPGARFIHLHRDPYKVFASTVHLYLKAQEAWGLHNTSRDLVVEHVLESYPELMKAFFAQREGLEAGELVDVGFRSLQQDPIGTLSAIYERLELPGFDAAVGHFEDYLESQRAYQKNQLPLAGSERETVARRWGDVFECLGYPV
jgi:omega-hydroxy-beta-dihydromenaquinone-9 sulfotransferase